MQENAPDAEANDAADDRDRLRAEHEGRRLREEVAREHTRRVLHLMTMAP